MNITLRRYYGAAGTTVRLCGGAWWHGAAHRMRRGGTTTAQLRCANTRVGWEAEPPTPHARHTSEQLIKSPN